MFIVIRAYDERERGETRRAAWVTANLMNAAGVRPRATVDRLLGETQVNNDAVAAMLGGASKTGTAKKGSQAAKAEAEARRKEFVDDMRRRSAEAKHAAKAKPKG